MAEAAMVKQKIENFTMKMQLYPTPTQAAQIDEILRALQIAYNITFHEVFQCNPAVCTEPKADGMVWPDYEKMAKPPWKQELIRRNPAIQVAPAAALTTNNGLFLLDAKRAWATGMHNLPVQKANRKDFRFYNPTKPRRSFMVQIPPQNIEPSADNPKVAWVTLPKIDGKIKARGFNRKLSFGTEGELTFEEARAANFFGKSITIRVTKDPCGSYFVCITFSSGKSKQRTLFQQMRRCDEKVPLGMDVGVKDVAILSDGTKFENPHFKNRKKKKLEKINRRLSRRWGLANPAYRDYAKSVRGENRCRAEEDKLPLPQPSRGYQKIQHDHALLERKIARQRSDYYHKATERIAQGASVVAVETLRIQNMMQNHRLAFALADAAMYDFVGKLKYKVERRGVKILYIPGNEPTSQRCSACGYINPKVKDLNIRQWSCPKCRAKHDRDVNAAVNILRAGLEKGVEKDAERTAKKKDSTDPPRQKHPRKARDTVIWEGEPNIVVQFSKELTKWNDPRYIIVNKETNELLDDAQGAGYRSAAKAKNCFKAKRKRRLKNQAEK